MIAACLAYGRERPALIERSAEHHPPLRLLCVHVSEFVTLDNIRIGDVKLLELPPGLILPPVLRYQEYLLQGAPPPLASYR